MNGSGRGQQARVVVIGAGPAGIGVAVGLAERGIRPVILIDRENSPGGIPALYRKKPGGVPTFVLRSRGRLVFGEELAGRLASKLRSAQVEVWLESQVTELEVARRTVSVIRPWLGRIELSADAVVLACGARERTPAERGWITGSRPAGVFFTKNLLEMLDRHGSRPGRRAVILGSDLVAWSAAAKFKAAGAQEAILVDQSPRPECSLPARVYFRRWVRPQYCGVQGELRLAGARRVSGVSFPDGTQLSCDALIISGELTPASELALMAGLPVELASRRPLVDRRYRFSAPGWFAAGNILGGSRGAESCYRNGLRVARSVAEYLRSG